MNDNINLLVLKSFFEFKSVWLSEIEFLKSDYALLTSKSPALSSYNGI